jgi:hypothetical protein
VAKQNSSLTRSQTAAPERTSTLMPPTILVERTYVRSEWERRGTCATSAPIGSTSPTRSMGPTRTP